MRNTLHVIMSFYTCHCSFLSVLVSTVSAALAGGIFLSSCTNLCVDEYAVQHMSKSTCHFTLAHRASWMPIKAKKCGLPFVMYADQRKTMNNSANTASRARRNVGWRDEPGLRMKEMNGSSSSDAMSSCNRNECQPKVTVGKGDK